MVLATARPVMGAAAGLHRYGRAGRNAGQPLNEGLTAQVPPLLDAPCRIYRTHGKLLFCQVHADGYSAHGKLLFLTYRW